MTTTYVPQTQSHWLLRFSTSSEILRRLAFIIAFLVTILLGMISFLEALSWVDKPFAGFLMNRRLTVSPIGMPDWPGTQAGLQSADRLLEIDGQRVTKVEDLENAVMSNEIGSLLEYTVERQGQVLTFSVPITSFSPTDLLGTFGATFFRGLIFFAIGIVVFVLKPDSTVSLLFFIATTLLGASNFVDFSVNSSASPFSYMVIVTENILSALVFHFSALFPFRYAFVDRRPRLLYIPYVISVFIIVLLLLLYPGPLFYRIYFLLAYSYIYLAIFCFLGSTLYSYFKSDSSLAKQRARVIFWGALIAFPLPILAALIANTGTSIDIPIFTNLTALMDVIFPVAIAYSITRHNLFDVDIYIKRAVGYGLMTLLLGSGYFGIQLLLKGVVLSDAAEQISPILFALLVVFFFNPLNRRIQGVIDRIFFRKKFDYKEAVIAISDALSSVLDLEEIVNKIIGAIRSEMFIDNAGVIVLGQKQDAIRGFFQKGEGNSDVVNGQFAAGNAKGIIDLVKQQRQMITRYDIEESPHYMVDRDDLIDSFNGLGATMLIPMIYQDQVNAIVTVGRKKSGQFFTKEDVELLKTLASHGAISIENAHLAKQMKHEEIIRTNLSRYLSPQIVEGIVKSDLQVNLGGDRKTVTVLFSDIRDFTRITENQPPDQLVRMLNEYFTAMAEVIFAHQGSLDKYIGDAIVAVFGSLIPLENPGNQAVKAAIDMMRRLNKLNEMWEDRGDFPMHMGIGICTGEVFLGNIGSIERMEFTVIGDTVNMASRLSGVAAGGQIVVTDGVETCLDQEIQTRALPPVQVKGKEGTHKVFEIIYPPD